MISDALFRPLGHGLVRRDGQGSARNTSNSLSGMVSTLVPVLILSGAFFFLFLILRRTQRRQYAPRTYLGTLREEARSPALPSGFLNWITAFLRIPDSYVLNHHSLDAYLFLRYLRIGVAICFFGCLITWPVLFPINITGRGGNKQLDLLSMSNVVSKNRLYAHAIMSWVFFGFVLFMVTRESIFYINLRQAYLLSPLYANRISSRTVLFTSVPNDYLDEVKLRRIFGSSVKNVWLCTKCKDVEDLVKERDKVAMQLEAAETKLIRVANGTRLKEQKKGGAGLAESANGHDHVADESGGAESGAIASRWVPRNKRPMHRLTPLIGKKVDTIDWCRAELERLLPKVEACQEKHRAGQAAFVNAVFVEFYTQSAAQDAFQSLTHHQPLQMSPSYIGIRPEEVIWGNMRIKWWERIVRLIATTAFVAAMIVFWAIPVAAVGAISNINYLTAKVPFLKFINHIPTWIRGVVTGLLPAVLLAVLIALVPVILRLMAKLGGAPSLSRIELTVQHSYFAFQVVQVFLVTTLASAASASVAQIIQQPSSTTGLLANSLPKASNFYIAYFILQGLTLSSGALLQIVGLILYKVLSKVLDTTPRKIYKRWANLSGLGWGSVYPVFTTLVVISITYSCIAPLVLGFSTVGLWLVYLAYRYNILFVYDSNIDTKGLTYPRALQQTLTGVYLAELCLLGLFGIAKAPGPIIIEAALLVFTVVYHLSLNAALRPHLQYLPKTMAREEEHLIALENGHNDDGGERDGELKTPGNGQMSEKAMRVSAGGSDPAPVKKPNFLTKWLRPDKYSNYYILRRLVPRHFAEIAYPEDKERHAYYHPAIASPTPMLWIPRDESGVSQEEVRHTSKVLPITDEGATLDGKNNITMNEEERPPIHEETIYY
ncbi:MAG: hypothetical protein M1826_000342 [Phylliscum demangeonii]|nr:MAG: hypothetical protein M1826_000342 [Phylliscum demangeonii]